MSDNKVTDENFCFISIMFLVTLSIGEIQVFNICKYYICLILHCVCDLFESIVGDEG